jgi:hypothetical protein
MSNPETVLQQEIRLALGRYPDLTLWRNSTGVATVRGSTVRFGLCVGSADLIGILAPHGRLVALEVKTATGRASDEQRMFLALVRSRGGFAALVRSVPEAIEAINRARSGANE